MWKIFQFLSRIDLVAKNQIFLHFQNFLGQFSARDAKNFKLLIYFVFVLSCVDLKQGVHYLGYHEVLAQF